MKELNTIVIIIDIHKQFFFYMVLLYEFGSQTFGALKQYFIHDMKSKQFLNYFM